MTRVLLTLIAEAASRTGKALGTLSAVLAGNAIAPSETLVTRPAGEAVEARVASRAGRTSGTGVTDGTVVSIATRITILTDRALDT
jgi:hypothetical protein